MNDPLNLEIAMGADLIGVHGLNCIAAGFTNAAAPLSMRNCRRQQLHEHQPVGITLCFQPVNPVFDLHPNSPAALNISRDTEAGGANNPVSGGVA